MSTKRIFFFKVSRGIFLKVLREGYYCGGLDALSVTCKANVLEAKSIT